MDIYAEQIVDLYKNPLNKRIIEDAQIMHSGTNTTCGDHVRVYLKVDDRGASVAGDKTIADASFEGEGCAISIAAASLLTEELKGMMLSDAQKLSKEDIFALLGVPSLGSARVKCAVLCLESVHGGIANYT